MGTAGQEVFLDESLPAALSVAVDASGQEADESSHEAGIDHHGVAVPAPRRADRFHVQRVVPAFEHPSVFVAADREAVFVDVEDLDRVPVGRDAVEGEDPPGAGFSGTNGFGASAESG